MCSYCESYFLPSSSCRPTLPPNITPSDTKIADTGSRGIYLTSKASCANINPAALQVLVGTAGGPPHHSSPSYEVNLPIPVTKGHLITNFHHNLMGIVPLCDHGCRVLFEKKYVTSFSKDGTIILRGWHEPSGAKLWRFSLRPEINPEVQQEWSSGPTALNAHDLPSVVALVRYLHAATGFPVKSTWLAEIKDGNYASCPGLTYANSNKYCPVYIETLQGHLNQSWQGAHFTKPKTGPVPRPPKTKSKELYITTEPIRKLYTDDMGRFPVRSRSGNNFLMLYYHVDTNVILVDPFESRHDRH